MSTDEPPVILLRRCKERTGIRLKPEYLKIWHEQLSAPITDIDQAYNELVLDFLSKDISVTSEPAIQNDFGESVIDTFPAGHLRQGGGVVLQIQDAEDISNSAFSLLNTLNNLIPVRQVYIERSGEDQVDLPRGILRWTLTDGFRQIQALELETIPDLDLKTPFGCKLLVKNCQVRRGMLLITKNSISVLGGDVPEMYGGNMIKELTSRLRIKLGLEEEPNTPIPENSTPLIETTNMDEDYDGFDDIDGDVDFSALESLENTVFTEDRQSNTPSTYLSESMQNDEASKSIEIDDDDDIFMRPTLLSPVRPHRASNSSSILSLSKKKRNQNTPEKPNTPDKPSDTGSPATSSIGKVTQHAIDLAGDSQDVHMESQSQSLTWIDTSVWDSMQEMSTEGFTVDDQGRTHVGFETLQTILRKMDSKEEIHGLKDTYVVKAICKKLSSLKMSRLHGFYLVVELRDPDKESEEENMMVVFQNKVISKLLDFTTNQVMEIYKKGGQKEVAKKVFKPLESHLKLNVANYVLDISVMEEVKMSNAQDSEILSMPRIIAYESIV